MLRHEEILIVRDPSIASDRRHLGNPQHWGSGLVASSRAGSAAPACLVGRLFKHRDLLAFAYLDDQRVPGCRRDQPGAGRNIGSADDPLDVPQSAEGLHRAKVLAWRSRVPLIEQSSPAVVEDQRLIDGLTTRNRPGILTVAPLGAVEHPANEDQQDNPPEHREPDNR